jgi:hypothetical protein
VLTAPVCAEGDFDTLLRAGSSRIAALSRAEHALAAQIFAQPADAIACVLPVRLVAARADAAGARALQERVCGQLYDAVRPRLIRAASLERLAAAIDALREFASDEAHGRRRRNNTLRSLMLVQGTVQAQQWCFSSGCLAMHRSGSSSALVRALSVRVICFFVYKLPTCCGPGSYIHDAVGARTPPAQLQYPALLTAPAAAPPTFAPVDAAATLLRLAAGTALPTDLILGISLTAGRGQGAWSPRCLPVWLRTPSARHRARCTPPPARSPAAQVRPCHSLAGASGL